MEDYVKQEIARENRAEANRAARMGAGDWSLVLAAALLVAAVLGFIYVSESEGVPAAGLEPAAGTASAPAPAYDDQQDALMNEDSSIPAR